MIFSKYIHITAAAQPRIGVTIWHLVNGQHAAHYISLCVLYVLFDTWTNTKNAHMFLYEFVTINNKKSLVFLSDTRCDIWGSSDVLYQPQFVRDCPVYNPMQYHLCSIAPIVYGKFFIFFNTFKPDDIWITVIWVVTGLGNGLSHVGHWVTIAGTSDDLLFIDGLSRPQCVQSVWICCNTVYKTLQWDEGDIMFSLIPINDK